MFSYRKYPYFIPYFLHLVSIFSSGGLIPYLTLSYNLVVYCLFLFHSIFWLIHCLMTTCWGQIRYPIHAGHDTFSPSGSSPINAVIFNSLIWDFTLFEAVFYLWFPPTNIYQDIISRESATQGWRVLSTHETDYPRRMPRQYFKLLGVIVVIIYYYYYYYY